MISTTVAWNQWRDNLLAAVEQHIPTKKIKGRNSPPWMNGNIIHTISWEKEAARRKLKSSPTDALRTKFKELRATVKKMVKESRASLFNSLDSTFQSNLKRFWSINKQSTIPDTMSMNSTYGTTTSKPTSVSTPSGIADMFNRYFISVFSSDDPEVQSHPPSPSPTCLLLSDVQVTEVTDEILRTLLKLETTKATGPDSIPSRL